MENQTSQLDPQALALAKAIARTETGGHKDPYKARGGSGEFGAYQFMPATWKSTATRYGVNTPLERASVEEQNRVTYSQIKEWKDKGYNPAQIASMWNAGAGRPNAYKEGHKGEYNRDGKIIKYDVPGYVMKVSKAYRELSGSPSVTPQTEQAPVAESAKPKGIASTVFDALTESEKNLGETIGRTILGGDKYFTGIQQKHIDNAQKYLEMAKRGARQDPKAKYSFEQLAEQEIEAARKVGADFKGRTAKQIIGDVMGVALDVGTTLTGAGALKAAKTLTTAQKIGKAATTGAKIGGAYGVTQGLQSDKDLMGVAKSGALGAVSGGLLGGGLSATGSAFQKITSNLSKSFIKGNIPGLNEETAQFALTKKLGSPEKMYEASEKSLQELGKRLDDALTRKGGVYVQPTGEELFGKIANSFPDSGLTARDVVIELKKLVPLKKKLVDKVASGKATLKELHELNSAIGKATFKSVFDNPAVKAGKQVGSTVYHTISDFLKEAAPESAQIFDEFSKEISLNGALYKAIRRGDKYKVFTLTDLLGIMSGFGAAGPLGALGGYAITKMGRSPTANLKFAGMLNLPSKPVMQGIGNVTGMLAERELGKSLGR